MKKFVKDFLLILSFAVSMVAMSLSASAEETGAVATGDGRIFLAVGVLAAAIVVVVVMLILSKKTK